MSRTKTQPLNARRLGRRVTVGQIPGVRLLPLQVHRDSRGGFRETYRRSWVPEARVMVQGNQSDSAAGVLRGLHYHLHQSDYWHVPRGRVQAALADLRPASPSFGGVATVELAGEHALYIPPGVGHGYLALSDCTLAYLVDRYYDPQDEHGVAWNDPDLNVPWSDPGSPLVLSLRDQSNPPLRHLLSKLAG